MDSGYIACIYNRSGQNTAHRPDPAHREILYSPGWVPQSFLAQAQEAAQAVMHAASPTPPGRTAELGWYGS